MTSEDDLGAVIMWAMIFACVKVVNENMADRPLYIRQYVFATSVIVATAAMLRGDFWK